MVELLVFACVALGLVRAHVLAETWLPGPSGLDLDRMLAIYLPASDAVDSERCRQDSAAYKQAARDGVDWALRMLDASSKVPSGLLTGNVVALGNYDECLMVKGVVTASGRFSGQNCMVTLEATSTKHLNVSMFPLLRWSLCIPSSCTAGDLQVHLRSVLQDEIGDSLLTVADKSCRSRDQTIALTSGAWFAILFFAIVGAITVLSTAYDVVMRDSDSHCALVASFSVFSNGRQLLDSPVDTDTLQAVHGMRAVSIMWILLGQTFYIHSLTPAINSKTMMSAQYDWDHLLIRNSELGPDTFLLLSGLLVCYGFLRDMEKNVSFNIPYFYLHRYIRLTPTYAAMILFTATLFERVDDGPLWGEYTVTCQSCRDNWWAGLLYLNNYINVDSMCLEPSWFLAVYMQLYLLSPLVLYPLWRWPRAGKALVGVLIGVGVLTSFLVVFINKIPVNDYGRDARKLREIPTHMRFTPWLIGIGLGSALHAARGVTSPAPSKLLLAGCSLVGSALQFSATLLLPLFQQPGHEYDRWLESLFSCLNKPAWALGVAWIVYACARGYAVPIDTLLSWKVLRVLGRLAYGVYLVHVCVLMWLFGTVRTPMYLHDRTIMINFSAILLISFGGALVLFLVFEAPAITIEQVLMKNASRRKQGLQTKLCDELENEETKFPAS